MTTNSFTPTRPAAHRSLIPLALLAGLVALTGCGTVPRAGSPENPLPAAAAPDAIAWPARYQPEDAGFFVHNAIDIQAPPAVVWELLIAATDWPTWYVGASDVVVTAADGSIRTVLTADAAFTWRTMGFSFPSTVTEFAPPYRLSWESRKAVLTGYHAWLIIPHDNGCRVITEESQHGLLTVLQRIFVPRKLHRLHDVWLAALKERAEQQVATITPP